MLEKNTKSTETLMIDDIIANASRYIKDEAHLNLIKKAYELALSKHEGQFRKSGEPYIYHPLAVAYILTEWQVGPKTITSGILHDLLEDTDVSKEELAELFDADIASLVDGVTKLTQLDYVSKESAQAENHRKMLLAMSRDIRVILIKLADRLHNTRTLKYLSEDKQSRISHETMDIYVPIAHRLGMYQVKAELEDTSLRYLEPASYYDIVRLMDKKKHEREEHVNRMIDRIAKILDNEDVSFNIKGRIKNIFSIYKKMAKGDKEFEEIYDLLAIRIIVDSVQDCYGVLGLIHANFKPIPNRFKDYIAMPKPNMYQSLHTTVIARSGNIYEIQIRTSEMDDIAERGIAAHWAYKEGAKSAEEEQKEIQDKLKWYDKLSTFEEELKDTSQLLEFVKEDIFNANVYVFTPKGDVFDFPPGATPIDFAYRIHTDLGHQLTGAIVNGKIAPLSYQLKMGDVIEIKSARNSFGPSEEWLTLVKTTQARQKIRQFFNKAKRQDNVSKGEKAFLSELKSIGRSLSEVDLNTIISTHKKLDIKSWDDLYHKIGRGFITAKKILEKHFTVDVPVDEEKLVAEIMDKGSSVPRKVKNRYGIIVDGLTNIDIKLSKCCHPIPGDDIVGFITRMSGIAIHHRDCINVQGRDDRLIDAWFSSDVSTLFSAKIRIRALSRNNLLSDIITKLSNINATIENLNTSTGKDIRIIDLELGIHHLDALNRSVNALRSIPDIYSVERVLG